MHKFRICTVTLDSFIFSIRVFITKATFRINVVAYYIVTYIKQLHKKILLRATLYFMLYIHLESSRYIQIISI